MAQISYIKYTDVLEARRYDAEYFKPECLRIRAKLNNSQNLKFFLIENPQYGTTPQGGIFETQGINFIRSQDFQNNFVSDISQFCTKEFQNKNKKSKVLFEDVLLAVVGATIGDCAIYLKSKEANINQNVARLRLNKEILSPYFLITFLISKFGQNQLLGLNTGNAQSYLNTEKLNELKIPLLPQSFQFEIEKIIQLSHQKQSQSKQLYREAEKLLLSELGLLDYQVKHALSFFATKKEIDQAKRYDSEYFQPKYAEIIKKIEEYEGGWDFAGEIVKWKKGVEVGTEAYTETGKDFVRVSDFSIYGTSEANRKISDEAFEELKKNYQPKQGEILFTKDGTIGISYVLKEDIQGVLSGAFLRLTLKEKYQDFEKECLALILNSILCKMQVEKLSGGAIIAHLKPSDFETFKIPLIKQSIQKQIAEKIQESHKLRKESKKLLEDAKRKVEEEIEKR